MCDNFGRHKSTRWVNASVPTYGDEWGDDYDYDSKHGIQPELDNEKSQGQKNIKGNNKTDEGVEKKKLKMRVSFKSSNDLILSIDKLKCRVEESDDSYSEEEGTEIVDNAEISKKNQNEIDEENSSFKFIPTDKDNVKSDRNKTLKVSNNTPIAHNINTKVIGDNKIFASTPTSTPTVNLIQHYNTTPATHQPDIIYQSDTDSIQNEPNRLNVIDYTSLDTQINFVGKDILNKTPKSDSTIEQNINNEILKHSDHQENEELEIDNAQTKQEMQQNIQTSETQSSLVLSIDNMDFNVDDDNSSDDWVYNREYSNDELTVDKNKDENKKDKYDLRESDNNSDRNLASQRDFLLKNKIKANTLDSLINQLQNASMENDDYDYSDYEHGHDDSCSEKEKKIDNENIKENLLLKMDSINDISLDFEKTSFYKYENDKLKDLNTNLSDNKDEPEPFTPTEPLSMSGNRKEHEKFINKLSGCKLSVRKIPLDRESLASVDYSNIADAVSGYMNDQSSIYDNALNEISETKDKTELEKGEANMISTIKSHSIRPMNSTTSLSSSKYSVYTNNTVSQTEDNYNTNFKVKEINRKDSTFSTNTSYIGNWNPDFNSFRDKFINDNDNESHLNFNPCANEINANYNKFTKSRAASDISDVISSNSSFSVPETIDANLATVDEKPSDSNYDNGVSFDDGSSDTTKSTFISDSLLKDHQYIRPIFKEERLTPLNSKDNLLLSHKNQKYSALPLPEPPEKVNKPDKKRVDSITSISSTSSDQDHNKKILNSSPINQFISKDYPPYNWKKIMSTSQPIDRINLLKDALAKESKYNTGLRTWLNVNLKLTNNISSPFNITIGKITSEAYQNAVHNDIRRHVSIRSKVSIVKDKVETSGFQASSFGKRFLNRGKKLMKSAGGTDQ